MITNVHDLLFPSPAPLEEIASTVLVTALWRREISVHRETNTLHQLDFQTGISVSDKIPRTPLVIFRKLVENIEQLEGSISEWIQYHFKNVFCFHRDNEFDILRKFDDFVCDFDSNVDFDRTAKRMLLCDDFNDDEKFKIACLYCLEEEIVRMRAVSEKINLDEIPFGSYPQLYFWICNLRNELHKIPKIDEYPEYAMEDVMFDHLETVSNWYAIEYFWNRLYEGNRLTSVKYLYTNHTEVFVRYIIQKLHGEELDTVVPDFTFYIIDNELDDEENEMYIFTAVMYYIENQVNETIFIDIFKTILTADYLQSGSTDDGIPENRIDLIYEIFTSAPVHFKRTIIRHIISNANNDSRFKIKDYNYKYRGSSYDSAEEYFDDYIEDEDVPFLEVHLMIIARECSSLLATIISEATEEERSDFWHRNLPTLKKCQKAKDLQRLKKLCLKSEDGTAGLVDIKKHCSKLLNKASFKKLNDFLNLNFTEKQTIRNLKQQLLQKDFLNGEHFRNRNPKLLSVFIDEAFEEVDQAAEYKTKLLNSLHTMERLLSFVKNGSFLKVVNFIDSLASKQDAVRLKERILDFLRRHLISIPIESFTSEELRDFCSWSCESDHKRIEKFKETLPIEEMFHNWTEHIKYDFKRYEFPKEYFSPKMEWLNEFLNWYFVNSEAVEEFKRKHPVEFENGWV